ncbi:hypothetical protein N658DRAFT_233879 [Parathielavia hyrcaniae]|uniref:Uncharacterized protein n=1 Tax=Parathielavia hyrcaniae TaxID=113614 RepID=A0AAN6T4M4_9PEZI|nr:hypothetical protein N658DRAFT_233879 [Parathielavia hyrcaniae]
MCIIPYRQSTHAQTVADTARAENDWSETGAGRNAEVVLALSWQEANCLVGIRIVRGKKAEVGRCFRQMIGEWKKLGREALGCCVDHTFQVCTQCWTLVQERRKARRAPTRKTDCQRGNLHNLLPAITATFVPYQKIAPPGIRFSKTKAATSWPARHSVSNKVRIPRLPANESSR